MSLRSRLLIAIGVIALVALAIADVVTYSALESFLYQRVDQQLDQFNVGYERGLNNGGTLLCYGGPGRLQPGGSGPAWTSDPEGGPPSNAVQIAAVEVRTPTGAVVNSQSCPSYVDGTAYTPQLPGTITGFTTAPDGTPVAYFDAPSTQPNGPGFRVRASTLADGNYLIVAQPLGDTGSTIHHLLLVELAVTGGAVVVALLGGACGWSASDCGHCATWSARRNRSPTAT